MSQSIDKEFFLVSLPGLEDLVLSEVKAWFPHLDAKQSHGGVTVLAPMEVGLSMNRALKIPTRILLRVSSFTCRDFPKLFNKISDFNWAAWLDTSCELEVHASSTRSRLKMKKRIEETCEKAWKKVQKKKSGSSKATLYVRLNDNLCTLSLDTSGERLHKRGIREHIGDAPLRETIAAALVQLLDWQSSPKPVELIDPMMGSGTFLIEAALRDQLIEQRNFAFAKTQTSPALHAARTPIANLIGFERDKKTLAAAKNNLAGLSVTIIEQDFFMAEPLPPRPSHQRWLLCNPPYGERIKIAESLESFYTKLFAKAEEVVRPERACFLLPAKAGGRLTLPSHWRIKEKRRFSNGGIPVIAFVFERKNEASEISLR